MAVELENELGQKLTFGGKESISIDISINEIGEIDNRQGVKSQKFKLTLTSENLVFLGVVSTFALYKAGQRRINCVLFQNNLQIAKGFLQVEAVDLESNTADTTFYGGNVTWFELAKQVYLDQLDFNEFNHVYNIANILESWGGLFGGEPIWTNGYIYPFVDYGRLTDLAITNNGVFDFLETTLTDWFPAVYVRQVLRKFEQYSGYKFVGEFINSPTITGLILPYSRKDRPVSYSDGFRFAQSITNRSRQDLLATVQNVTGAGIYSKFVYPIEPLFDRTAWSFGTSTYTVEFEGIYAISFSVSLQGGNDPFTGNLEIRVNNISIANVFLNNSGGSVSANILLVAGDEVTFWKKDNANKTCLFRSTIILGNGGLNPNSLFQLKTVLPHITVAELMKQLANMFGLMFQVDSFSKQINCFTFEEVVRGTENALDWTHKISGQGSFTFLDVVKNYAQKNYFKWADIESLDPAILEYNRLNSLEFGDGFIEIDNSTIETEKDVFESKFAPTSMGQAYEGDVFIPTIQMWDGAAYTKDPKIRMLYVTPNETISRFVTGGTSTTGGVVLKIDTSEFTNCPLTYFYITTDIPLITEIQETLQFDEMIGLPIQAGQNLLDRFYPSVVQFLNDNKLVEIELELNEIDIQNLDFKKMVYLGYPFYSYFFVSLIKAYDPNKALTKAELIKLF